VDYEVEGAVDGSIGDRKTLIDARHFDPPLYVQARISEQTEALLETSNVKTTLSNYVRKSSQIANELLQRVEQLALEAAPYTIKLATNNGIVFKNNQGQSTIYPSLKRGQKPVECTWKWLVDNQGFGTSPTFEVQAAGMSSKLVLTAIALIDGKEVAREQVTFTNVNDGKNGSDGKSITVTKAEKQADGVKVTFSDNKSIVVPKGDKGAIDEEKLKKIEQNINSKADGTLTQEQLNALNEKNSIMRAEWEAKASLDTLNKAIAEYKRYTLKNDKDKAQSEKDLISLNQRLVENIRNLKELAERWNFLDKYFQVGNEGIIFGEQNGNTCAKMSNNRFSIFSAGTEVMYISQGTLFIENGIFSKSIQIGRFREEQYNLNLDMNVIRYVGGI
ncbi:antireceptor, partial [Streptococcus anginosus]|nr:antireceptor [Streptococcus anginosus]